MDDKRIALTGTRSAREEKLLIQELASGENLTYGRENAIKATRKSEPCDNEIERTQALRKKTLTCDYNEAE